MSTPEPIADDDNYPLSWRPRYIVEREEAQQRAEFEPAARNDDELTRIRRGV